MAVVALYNPAGHLGDHLDNLPPPADHSACWSSMIERRNDKTVRMHKWFPLTSNHSTQSRSGMREATHPVPLIRERIVLLNFVKTKYSHRLTFDIGPWFLTCASVSGRNLINITILRAFYQAMVQYVQRSSRSIIYWSNTNFTVRCLLA